ncbi:MAG TPA: lipoyl(octanoyl) transferase LipB [Clostridia bacterium]|nr:lipoyl(octanoyl) transferase LipB [Clostridia bacterium]
MEPILVTVLPGITGYPEGLSLQRRLLALRQENQIPDILLLLEHPPVLTLGKNANDTHILLPPEVLAARGIQIYQTERGGNVTYHGPGQIVGYPIINLKENGTGVKEYVALLEELFIDLLAKEYAINAYRDPEHRGVWIGDNKITAIGVAVKRWVTMHGFAFNVNTNLEHFKVINPCGIIGRGVTSLQAILGKPLEMEVVRRQVMEYFCRAMKKKPVMLSVEELRQRMGDEPVAPEKT